MTYLNQRISAIGYGNSNGIKWETFQIDTSGTLLWSSTYNEPTPHTVSDSYPYNLVAKATGEVIVTGVGGPTPDPLNPSFNQMPIVQYSNTGVQNWMSTPNIYAGSGLAVMLASDGSLYAIGSRNMFLFHYNSTTTSINENGISENVFVVPNPCSDKVTFTVSSNELSTLSLYDVLGKEIVQKTFTTSTTLNMDQLEKGIFIYVIRNGKMTNKTGKLVKN
jgi:hypothetical protein